MFIKIAPMVKVYISDADMAFIQSHSSESFRSSNLPPSEQERAKILADKAIFVRKKLDNDVQYALNRKIRIFRNDTNKKI
tara:strand:+ start:249 stop:488 length:240 start_codon:yes stop_codon:yes gene_type:complete